LNTGEVELDAEGFWSGFMRLPGVMFRSVPVPMLTVTYLLKVNLSGNIISEFPMNLLRCESLVELRLDRNDFTHIPLELSRNTKLEVLTLYGNPRLAVPSAYVATKGGLYLLEYFRRFSQVFNEGEQGANLDLLNMRLPVVPPEVCAQTQLIRLSLSRNRLSWVPPDVGRLSFLVDLNLSWNYLYSLPDTLGDLDRLEVLNFESNKLYTLPDSMSRLSNLRVLRPNSNRLGDVPSSVLEQGPLKVLQFIGRSKSCRSTGELDLAEFRLTKYPGAHALPELALPSAGMVWGLLGR
jgi:Leucine-rich repeat (LRR) protein